MPTCRILFRLDILFGLRATFADRFSKTLTTLPVKAHDRQACSSHLQIVIWIFLSNSAQKNDAVYTWYSIVQCKKYCVRFFLLDSYISSAEKLVSANQGGCQCKKSPHIKGQRFLCGICHLHKDLLIEHNLPNSQPEAQGARCPSLHKVCWSSIGIEDRGLSIDIKDWGSSIGIENRG